MPYINFHAARVKDPSLFKKIVMLKELPNGIQIYGGPLKEGENSSTTEQTYRFPVDKFSPAQAKAWLKEHNIESELESAIEKNDSCEIREVFHIDYKGVKIGKCTKTDEGYISGVVPVAKVGVLTYNLPDGSMRRELVPEDTLFNQDSMNSLKMKPITDTHPIERRVDSSTAKLRKVGFTGENVSREGIFLTTPVVVTDHDAVQNVDSGRDELSPGYRCDLLFQSGSFEGQHYDAIQLNRKYNHVALCDKARGGKEIRMNFDSEKCDGIEITEFFNIRKEPDMVKFKIDGIDYDCAPEVANYIAKIQGDIGTAKNDSATANTNLQKVTAERDTLKEKVDAFEKRDFASEVQKAANEKLALIETAKSVLDADELAKVVNLDALSIKKAVIMKKSPSAKLDDKNEIYIEARFDSVVENIGSSAISSQRQDSAFRSDGNNVTDLEKIKNDAEEKIKNSYRDLKNL